MDPATRSSELQQAVLLTINNEDYHDILGEEVDIAWLNELRREVARVFEVGTQLWPSVYAGVLASQSGMLVNPIGGFIDALCSIVEVRVLLRARACLTKVGWQSVTLVSGGLLVGARPGVGLTPELLGQMATAVYDSTGWVVQFVPESLEPSPDGYAKRPIITQILGPCQTIQQDPVVAPEPYRDAVFRGEHRRPLPCPFDRPELWDNHRIQKLKFPPGVRAPPTGR